MTCSPKSLYMRNIYPGANLSQIEENGFHVRNCWHSLFILRENRIGSTNTSKGMPSLIWCFFFHKSFESDTYDISLLILACQADRSSLPWRLYKSSATTAYAFRTSLLFFQVLSSVSPWNRFSMWSAHHPSVMDVRCFLEVPLERRFSDHSLRQGFLFCLSCLPWSFLFALGLYVEISFCLWVVGG